MADRPLKVMQVLAGGEHGGAETYFTDLVIALHRAGLDQLVVTRPHPTRVARLRDAGVAVETAPFGRFFDFTTGGVLHRALDHYRPTVWQSWMGRASERTPAETEAVTIGWFGGYYDLKRFRHSRHYVTVTRDIADHVVAQGAPADRVHVIHTLADLDPSAEPADRFQHGTAPREPLILCLARLHPKKGLDTLLQAMVKVPGAGLWLAGDGELKQELGRQIVDLGLGGRVRMMGWREDRTALLKAADVLVVPSRYEPFGTVMVEAWGTDTPLVAAASQGPSKYVEDGVNGLLVPVDDVDALATALGRALTDKDLRARIIAGGRATFEATFTEQRIVETYLDLYRRITA